MASKIKKKKKKFKFKKREKLIPISKQASLACKDLNFAKGFLAWHTNFRKCGGVG